MTEPLRLSKHHGLGNDFLVALEARNPGLVPDGGLAVALCDRHRGVGADGMFFGLAPDRPGADLRMVLFNADGSEAEISGNGIRCLAQAELRRRGEREGEVVVDGASGRRVLQSSATERPERDLLRVRMGAVGDGPELGAVALAVPALHRGSGSVGNPHVVLHVTALDEVDVADLGRRIEAEVAGGTNVHFLVHEGGDAVRLRHWERGAGVTEACGSGATVSADLAHRWGLVGDRVEVRMPGGTAEVDLRGDEPVLLGEAVLVAEIEVARG